MTTSHGGKPPTAATGQFDRIEQHAARAALHLDRYFTGDAPKPHELAKAKAALDDAIALLAGTSPDKPRVIGAG